MASHGGSPENRDRASSSRIRWNGQLSPISAAFSNAWRGAEPPALRSSATRSTYELSARLNSRRASAAAEATLPLGTDQPATAPISTAATTNGAGIGTYAE